MARQCPAAAYLSSLSSSGQDTSPPVIPTIIVTTADSTMQTKNIDLRNEFMKDLVEFIYRCHSYVKKCKEENPAEYTMSEAEKKENIQYILQLLAQRKACGSSGAQNATVASTSSSTKSGRTRYAQPSMDPNVTGISQMSGTTTSGFRYPPGTLFPPPRSVRNPQRLSPSSFPSSRLNYTSSSGVPGGVVRGQKVSSQSVGVCGGPGSVNPAFRNYLSQYKQTASITTKDYSKLPTGSYQRPVSTYGPYGTTQPVQKVAPPLSTYEQFLGGIGHQQLDTEENDVFNTAFIEEEETDYEEEDVYPYNADGTSAYCKSAAVCPPQSNKNIEEILNTAFIADDDAYFEEDQNTAEYDAGYTQCLSKANPRQLYKSVQRKIADYTKEDAGYRQFLGTANRRQLYNKKQEELMNTAFIEEKDTSYVEGDQVANYSAYGKVKSCFC